MIARFSLKGIYIRQSAIGLRDVCGHCVSESGLGEGMVELVRLMNATRWEEIRLGMYALGDLSPRWRVRDLHSRYLSDWDGEWFYHFKAGGYEHIEWLEVDTTSPEQTAAVQDVLLQVRVPGERIGNAFRVYGYVPLGKPMDYLG